MKRKVRALTQDDIAFNYYEAMRNVLRDLERIDSLIPAESSRLSLAEMDGEASAIIQARKNDLLCYIQTICRDHCYWGARLLHGGWKPEQRKRNGKYKGDSTGRKWIRRNAIG